MPSTGHDEERLIGLFLNVFERGEWAGDRARTDYPERVQDGAVDAIVTQVATGDTVAIEHTLIEPFIGEKNDLHRHFQRFAAALREDRSLNEPGAALFVQAPVNVLPRGTDWDRIIADTCAWLGQHMQSFGVVGSLKDCPSPHHPQGVIQLRVRRQPLPGASKGFVIVQRYGELRVGDSVRRALRRKLRKLILSKADRKLLFLERDQPFVDPNSVLEEIDRFTPEFGDLALVDQVWIVDTASFDGTRDYVDFQRYENAVLVESFAFLHGELESMSRDGVPIPRDWWPR